MAHNNPNSGIEELYRAVIQDVIEQSKEAFLDENIDTDVLDQIQKAWEEKINASGAADLNAKAAPPPPVVRPAPAKPQASAAPRPPSAASRSTSGVGEGAPTMVVSESAIPSTSNNNAQAAPQYNNEQLQMFRNAVGPLQNFQYSNLQQFVVPGMQGSNVMFVPVQLGNNPAGVVQISPEQFNQVPQTDGESFIPDLKNAEISLDLKAGTLIIDTSKANSEEAKIKAAVNKMKDMEMNAKKSKKIANLAILLPQVDGNGPRNLAHMSDSDSDEDDDEDPLNQMVNHINDKADEDDGDAGDEDPLNSADDQSDDEDLDTLFESSNIIVCQFEKVNRARNKWKFTLKDGIMHLEGKDYCFQKCTGEAEW